MKILYFDCFSGISGDMTIGALLDLGIDRERFLKELSKLNLDGYRIEIGTKAVNGIMGTDINVVLTDDSGGHDHEHTHDHGHDHSHDHDHTHDHSHDHEHTHNHDHSQEHVHTDLAQEHEHTHNHDHSHDHADDHIHGHTHDHTHDHTHGHRERGLIEIEQIIDNSSLSDSIKLFSKRVFREIAAAEAKVHGKPIYEVHFHEVGAIDSIVDIAGTAICLELLGVEKVYSSVLHDGNGFIECRHGIIPVPVPAVMEMLAGSGIPLISENVGTELVTPTGMGLIKCLAAGFGGMPPMRVEKTGYGHGKRNTGRLNALRVVLGETFEAGNKDSGCNTEAVAAAPGSASIGETTDRTASATADTQDEIIVMETNIDDTTPEILGYIMSRLFEEGALDAFFTPIHMKKNRPATMLTVLAKPGSENELAGIVLAESSTIGIRTCRMKRYCMERETIEVNTRYGAAKVKIATWGNIKKASPEYEDCKNIAKISRVPLHRVYEMVRAEAAKQVGIEDALQ